MLAVLKTKLVCSSAVVSMVTNLPPLDATGLEVPIPMLPLLPSTKNALASLSDSTRKSTSALSSLNTAPPFADKAPVNVAEPPEIAPVVVMVLEPTSIFPNPLVIDPESNAPVVTRLELPAKGLNVDKSIVANVLSPLKKVVLFFVPVPNLAIGIVPALILFAFIEATLNVPNATISTVSPFDNALAKTTEVPDVTVTSVPFTCLTPVSYTHLTLPTTVSV